MARIKLILLTTLFVISLSQCKKASVGQGSGSSASSLKTYLALGDSYTIGQSVLPSERFPVQAYNILSGMGIPLAPPEILATTGWTTTNLRDAIQVKNYQKTFDLVSLLIGVNDQYQTRDTSGYRMRFTGLLIRSIELAGGKNDHVFVLSIPDYSVTPFAAQSDTAFISRQIDQFNQINREVTVAYNCKYLEITNSTRAGRYDRSLIASDGLHPSGKEYEKWAARLAPMMDAVL